MTNSTVLGRVWTAALGPFGGAGPGTVGGVAPCCKKVAPTTQAGLVGLLHTPKQCVLVTEPAGGWGETAKQHKATNSGLQCLLIPVV